MFTKYVDRLCADIEVADKTAEAMGGEFERRVDSVYMGGGTPTVLAPDDLVRIFDAARKNFDVSPEAEVTVECAPGTLTDEMIQTLLRCGVNRVSLGVQSFVDEETRSVARLHTRAITLEEIERLRSAGITNISVDLIAGLPHQTAESWEQSLSDVIATGVPHCSVYMLEIDEDSRLGRELIAGGTRYHAHFVPDEDLTADMYVRAVEKLNEAGVYQYEISNFAREIPTLASRTRGTVGYESKHNLKYWTRQPYFGFGVDAHSMLDAASDPYVLLRVEEVGARVATDEGGTRPCAVTQADVDAVRFSTPDSLDAYLDSESHPPFGKGAAPTCGKIAVPTPVSRCAAREEEFFLGLRMNRGVDLARISARYGISEAIEDAVEELVDCGLLERDGSVIRLTSRGRLLSNEVFQRFITTSSNA